MKITFFAFVVLILAFLTIHEFAHADVCGGFGGTSAFSLTLTGLRVTCTLDPEVLADYRVAASVTDAEIPVATLLFMLLCFEIIKIKR